MAVVIDRWVVVPEGGTVIARPGCINGAYAEQHWRVLIFEKVVFTGIVQSKSYTRTVL